MPGRVRTKRGDRPVVPVQIAEACVHALGGVLRYQVVLGDGASLLGYLTRAVEPRYVLKSWALHPLPDFADLAVEIFRFVDFQQDSRIQIFGNACPIFLQVAKVPMNPITRYL